MAAHKLRSQHGLEVSLGITSLGGFPACRAEAHVKRSLRTKPEIVVVQFGSTDLTISMVRRTLQLVGLPRPQRSPTLSSRRESKGVPSTVPQLLRPSLAGAVHQAAKLLICRTLGIGPDFGDEEPYVQHMRSIARALRTGGAQPLILSPFPHGDWASDDWSRRFGSRLRDSLAPEGFFCLNSREAILALPPDRRFLADRLHLSQEAHAVLADLVTEAIVQHLALGAGS